MRGGGGPSLQHDGQRHCIARETYGEGAGGQSLPAQHCQQSFQSFHQCSHLSWCGLCCAGVSGEQGMTEVLELSQGVFGAMGEAMEHEAEAFLEQQRKEEEIRLAREREMDQIALEMAQMETLDPAIEERLFGRRMS